MTDLEIVKAITGAGSDDDALLGVLLEEASARILEMTGRTHLPDGLRPAVREYAITLYNRVGSEGMASRSDSEIGISSVFTDIPEPLMKQIQRWRLARVGGAYYEEA